MTTLPLGLLTVVITTSPTPSAPSTELVSAVVRSFHAHCLDLLSCHVVVVFDTYDHIGTQPRLKKGVVTEEGALHYDAYKTNVKKYILDKYRCPLSTGGDGPLVESKSEAEYGFEIEENSVDLLLTKTQDGRVTFIEPSKRLGFGLAVRSALRVAQTPYVWIQQHDWSLVEDIPLQPILQVMERQRHSEDAPVKYVCLPSTRMLSYAVSNHVVKFPALRDTTAALKGEFVPQQSGCQHPLPPVPLTPLFFWHDKPHLACREHYLSRVFPTRLAIQRGAFIEDLVGQRARDQMKEGDWLRWACWLYYPDEGKQLCVRHLQGRFWRGAEAELKMKDHWTTLRAQADKEGDSEQLFDN